MFLKESLISAWYSITDKGSLRSMGASRVLTEELWSRVLGFNLLYGTPFTVDKTNTGFVLTSGNSTVIYETKHHVFTFPDRGLVFRNCRPRFNTLRVLERIVCQKEFTNLLQTAAAEGIRV